MKIQSVLGEVDSSDLKFILPHEHLIGGMPVQDGISIKTRPGSIEYIKREVKKMLLDLRGYDVNGFCDCSTVDIGRDKDYVEMAKALSESTGVNIFLISGFYMPQCWLNWMNEASADKLGDFIIREFEQGIEDTKIFPAVIKSSIGFNGWTKNEEKTLTACAIAQKKTGAAIHVHSVSKTRKQTVDFLLSLGIKPSRIYMAHVEAGFNEDELNWFAEKQIKMIFTSWGGFPHETVISAIKHLILQGHTDKILLSMDFLLSLCNGGNNVIWPISNNSERTGFSYIMKHTMPQLLLSGISQNEIEIMMHSNPLHLLARE